MERRKLNAQKIKMHIHVMLRNYQVTKYLTQKFKPRNIFNVKISRSTVIPGPGVDRDSWIVQVE